MPTGGEAGGQVYGIPHHSLNCSISWKFSISKKYDSFWNIYLFICIYLQMKQFEKTVIKLLNVVIKKLGVVFR